MSVHLTSKSLLPKTNALHKIVPDTRYTRCVVCNKLIEVKEPRGRWKTWSNTCGKARCLAMVRNRRIKGQSTDYSTRIKRQATGPLTAGQKEAIIKGIENARNRRFLLRLGLI